MGLVLTHQPPDGRVGTPEGPFRRTGPLKGLWAAHIFPSPLWTKRWTCSPATILLISRHMGSSNDHWPLLISAEVWRHKWEPYRNTNGRHISLPARRQAAFCKSMTIEMGGASRSSLFDHYAPFRACPDLSAFLLCLFPGKEVRDRVRDTIRTFDEKRKHPRFGKSLLTRRLWSNRYSTLSDNPRQLHLLIRMKPKHMADEYTGRQVASSRTFAPRAFDEPRHHTQICKLLGHAWAIWRMRQGTFLRNNPYRTALVDEEVDKLKEELAHLTDQTTGNAVADEWLLEWAPDAWLDGWLLLKKRLSDCVCSLFSLQYSKFFYVLFHVRMWCAVWLLMFIIMTIDVMLRHCPTFCDSFFRFLFTETYQTSWIVIYIYHVKN